MDKSIVDALEDLEKKIVELEQIVKDQQAKISTLTGEVALKINASQIKEAIEIYQRKKRVLG